MSLIKRRAVQRMRMPRYCWQPGYLSLQQEMTQFLQRAAENPAVQRMASEFVNNMSAGHYRLLGWLVWHSIYIYDKFNAVDVGFPVLEPNHEADWLLVEMSVNTAQPSGCVLSDLVDITEPAPTPPVPVSMRVNSFIYIPVYDSDSNEAYLASALR